MDILVVADAFWPDHTGGISKSLLSEVEGLASRGHRVVVIARRLKKDSSAYEKREGYEVYRYLAPNEGSALYRTYPLFSIVQLPKLIRNLQIRLDVAYVHNPFQMLGIQWANLDLPEVYTFYAPILREIEIERKEGKYGFLSPLLNASKPFIRMAEYQALRRATVILVRSQFMKNEMRCLYKDIDPTKIALIPLAVDTVRFSFTTDPKAVRKRLGLPEDRIVLLTVRRLVARMGLENLVDAMRLVVEKHPKVLLLIGGKGYLENALRERIRSLGLERYIQLLGFIPEEMLPGYYQAADLFVLPTSELEGFGLATIEALSCGTPVVATPVGANPEVVGPLGSEFLCKDKTAEAIAERIIWWLDQGISTEVRQKCREYCVSRFTVEFVVASLEDIFARIRQRSATLQHN